MDNKIIAAEVSRLVWNKLMSMIEEDKSIIEIIGCNGISDVVLNVILEYKPIRLCHKCPSFVM